MIARSAIALSMLAAMTAAEASSVPTPPRRPAELSASPDPWADAAPLPPVRPPELLSYAPPPELRQTAPPVVPETPLADAACEALLAGGRVIATRVPAIAGVGGCGIAAPVSLKAIILDDARKIDVVPAPIMRCDLAAQLSEWVARDVVALLETNSRKVARIVTLDAYDCRGRNRVATAKLSEHGKGDAIDMSEAQFRGGGAVRFADRGNDLNVATMLRTSACARFSTVLGPGSDGYHEDHIHLDLEARRNGGKICQWNLR